MFNYYYDFLYLPLNTNGTLNTLVLNGKNLSIYSYEFVVDEKNIGGTIHFDFEAQMMVEINIRFSSVLKKFFLAFCFIKYKCEYSWVFIEKCTTSI
jgi:hypothetical protein